MPLTRRALLWSTAAAGALGPHAVVRGANGNAPKYLVVVFANGGWDVTFCMDPKAQGGLVDGPWVDVNPNDSEDVEELATYHGITIQENLLKRPAVSQFFQTWGDRTCVINGLWTGSIVHQPSRIRVLTGTTKISRPDFATITGFEKAGAPPLGSIDFSGLGYAGELAATTGRIGYNAQLKALIDPDTIYAAPSYATYELPLFDPNPSESALIESLLAQRIEGMREQLGDGGHNDRVLNDMLESMDRRAALLRDGELIVDPLTLGARPSLNLQADMAASLLKNGLCWAVTMAHFDSWDTHDKNSLQHERYEDFFLSLDRLFNNLQTEGLLDDTLVAVMSEMTRTPRLNHKTGKDHWPHTSAMLIGAGVSGGRVVGATDDYVESLPVHLETGEVFDGGALNKYDNLAAGILEHMGIDPEPWYPTIPPFRAATS